MALADFSFTQSFQDAFSTLMSYIPQLVGALIILLVGYIIAKLIAKLVTAILVKANFNTAMERVPVQQFLDRTGMKMTPASLIGMVVFWFVFIIALTMFASALGVPEITSFLNRMIAYIPNIFAAVVILFLAMLLGRFLAGLVRGATGSETLARLTNIAVLVYATFIALVQLDIAQQLTGPTFLIVLAGVALAAALAFGLGGRDEAQRLIGQFRDSQAASKPAPQHEADGGPTA